MWMKQISRGRQLMALCVALMCLASAETLAAGRSQLSYWLSDTALEEIEALASGHPRLVHRSLHVSSVATSALDEAITKAIGEVVQKQIDAGVTVINDGEMSKPSYATYVQDRLSGFRGESVQNYFFDDLQDFPRSAEMVAGNPGRRKRKAPSCTEAITVVDGQAAIDDMTALVAAAKSRGHEYHCTPPDPQRSMELYR